MFAEKIFGAQAFLVPSKYQITLIGDSSRADSFDVHHVLDCMGYWALPTVAFSAGWKGKHQEMEHAQNNNVRHK
jgi:hypothetical protein